MNLKIWDFRRMENRREPRRSANTVQVQTRDRASNADPARCPHPVSAAHCGQHRGDVVAVDLFIRREVPDPARRELWGQEFP